MHRNFRNTKVGQSLNNWNASYWTNLNSLWFLQRQVCYYSFLGSQTGCVPLSWVISLSWQCLCKLLHIIKVILSCYSVFRERLLMASKSCLIANWLGHVRVCVLMVVMAIFYEIVVYNENKEVNTNSVYCKKKIFSFCIHLVFSPLTFWSVHSVFWYNQIRYWLLITVCIRISFLI